MKLTKCIMRISATITNLFIYLFFLKIPIARASLWDVANRNQEMEKIGDVFGSSASDPADPRKITVNVIKVFLSLLAIIFVVIIIAAGYKWMTASGNEDRIKEAKSQIMSAIIGLLIIIVAWSITYFVTGYVLCAIDNDFTWCPPE